MKVTLTTISCAAAFLTVAPLHPEVSCPQAHLLTSACLPTPPAAPLHPEASHPQARALDSFLGSDLSPAEESPQKQPKTSRERKAPKTAAKATRKSACNK